MSGIQIFFFNSVSEESRQLFLDAIEENRLNLADGISVKVDDFNAIEVMKAVKVKME